ncbi:MAG: anaerobic ribonucleoside-triphosphate reductase activating protein [Lachnospiraceae bacterium]|nr:anaerobic ribonucleoside-triphosphate reductase activating protein [Lachnospiraceae bacterium]
MYYGMIKNKDVANGAGVRITLFVSGCRNHCRGCFQPETWDFSYGEKFTEETERQILDLLEPSYIDGLTLLGGDPFEPENQRDLLPLIKRIKKRFPEKNIWAFTGYLYEDLIAGAKHPCCEMTQEILSLIDVLVDGPFIEEQKNLALRFRGSENQRLIDLNATRNTGTITLIPDRKRGSIYG